MRTFHCLRRLPGLTLAVLLCATPAMAEKPDHAGGPKGDKQAEKAERKADKHAEKAGRKADKHAEKAERKAEKQHAKAERDGVLEPRAGTRVPTRAARRELQPGTYFNDRHRSAVRTYYAKACPPGLAKKNNGCLPPGQAKRWNVGQPLPTAVVLYPVPRPVLIHLPPQPAGYRYVRVSTDILLISITTRIVVDGMTDLLRM